MSPSPALFQEGNKFMWDGRVYATAEEAARIAAGYENDRFDVRLHEENGAFLVYTRRAVTEAAGAAQ